MDDWEDFPLFAPEGAQIPRVDGDNADKLNPTLGALSHILYDEETPEEISEQHRELGNRLFKRGKHYVKSAIQEYTEAIAANSDLPEVTAPAYANRAAAHLKLKNYGKCLSDCESCLKLQPGNVKARYRAAVSATAISRYDTAIKHCDVALNEQDNEEYQKQKQLFQKARAAAVLAKQREAEREQRVSARVNAEEMLQNQLKNRKITMGLPLFAQQRKYPITKPEVVQDRMYWPVLMLYPAEAIGIDGVGDQSDYLEQVAEDATIADLLATVFPPGAPPPEWDRTGVYRDHRNIDVLFRQDWTMICDEADSDDERDFVGSSRGPDEVGAWRTLSKDLAIAKAIATSGYVVPLFPVFYCVPKNVHLS